MNLIQKAIARSHALMSDEELASSPLHEMESTEKFAILEASLKVSNFRSYLHYFDIIFNRSLPEIKNNLILSISHHSW